MKKSLMFLFTLLISLAMLGVGNRSNAINFSSSSYMPGGTYMNGGDYNNSLTSNYYSSCGYFSTLNHAVGRGGCWESVQDSFLQSFNYVRDGYPNFLIWYDEGKFQYSFVYYDYNRNVPDGFRVYYNIDEERQYFSMWLPFGGRLITFPNGNQYLLDNIYFNNGSFVLMNRETGKTYQQIGKYGFYNRVLYLDGNPSNTSGQNVYLIDFEDSKARSANVSSSIVAKMIMGQVDISTSKLSQLNWSYTYNISTGGDNFRPITSYNPRSTQSFSSGGSYNGNDGYTYELIPFDGGPTFDGGNVSFDTGTNIEIYNDCFSRYNTVSMVSNDWYSCKQSNVSNSEMADVIEYLVTYTGDSSLLPSDITSVLECQSLILDARWMYSLYSGSYNSLIQIARSSSSVPNGVDVAGYCGNRPSENGSVWSDIIDFLGFGEDGRFSNTREYLENLVYETVYTNLWSPISTTFEEGFSKYGSQSCHAPIVETSYGNIILYFFGAVLIFVFLVFL